MQPLVAVIMGSKSDWAVMKEACLILEEMGISYEKKIVSAHRTPGHLIIKTACLAQAEQIIKEMFEY